VGKTAGERNYIQSEIDTYVDLFTNYIETHDIPIIAEFAYQNNVSKFIVDRPEFIDLKQKCLSKKETALEIGCLKGTLNAPMSIFSLKQIGWRDKQEQELTHKFPTAIEIVFKDSNAAQG
jgi:hypothetical protein